MRIRPLLLAVMAVGWALALSAPGSPVSAPPGGKLYHGVYPGGKSGNEDDATRRDLRSYERTVGQPAAWVYFSSNWFHSRAFPLATARWIRRCGAIPFIRLMLRSNGYGEGKADPAYALSAIIDGQFDADLAAWARSAKAFGSPLLVEYGTEVNGDWFAWNGKYAGGGELAGFGDPAKADGPERFVAAFRHIVTTMRGAGADNIAWVFHVDTYQSPAAAWNRFENYYPGDDVTDWLAVSDYGPQTPTDRYEHQTFRQQLDPIYQRMVRMAPRKPVIVAEFGCAEGNPHFAADRFADGALADLLGRRWPRIIGFSWWNEHWQNDNNPAHDTTMRVQDDAALAQVFRGRLAAAKRKLSLPVRKR